MLVTVLTAVTRCLVKSTLGSAYFGPEFKGPVHHGGEGMTAATGQQVTWHPRQEAEREM